MRKYLLAAAILCSFSNYISAQAPTTPASSVTFTNVEGGTLRMNWTNGNGARRIVVAREASAVTAVPVNGVDYNANATFSNGDAIQPGQFVVYDNTGTFVDVLGLQPNTVYHFSIFEYNGTGASTQYLTTGTAASQSTQTPPSNPASNLTFSNVAGSSMRLTWTNGNGVSRIVVGRAGGPVNANPVNLTTYFASTSFGSGSQIGTGNFVVFNGTANNVTVTNLAPNATYHFAVFEFNGTSGPVYNVLSPATGNQLTATGPSIASGTLTYTGVDGGSMRINWISGNGARRIVIARAGSAVDAVPVNGTDYAENSNFNLGAEISPGQHVVYDNTGSFLDITGLQPATTYHFRIYEYDGTGVNISYLTASFGSGSNATLSAPSNPASNLVFSNITGAAMQLNWTNGNGNARIVVAKANGPVDANPVNLTSYSGSTVFGIGSQIGSGNFVVLNSIANTATITNLAPNTTYHFAVFEYNGNSGPVYNVVNPAIGNQVTAGAPTVAASALSFTSIDGGSMRLNWTNGNGARRIVVIRAGSAVDAIPVNGTDYAENSNFNLGAEISPGQHVVYDNTGTFADISGLQPATVYHFRIYEYNGTGVNILYLTASFGSASQSTTTAPTVQATGLTFSNVAGSSVRLAWTNGNGVGRVILAKANSPVDAVPANLTFYSNINSFGNGTQIGSGNYVVYTGSGNNVTVTNLSDNTTYHFAVFEYNGGSGLVYNTVSPATGNQLTAASPTIASSAITFTSIDGASMRLNWTSGNGARRIVVARAGSAVDAVPVNGTDYAENSNFNLAAEISPGQRVVYDNTGTFADISGLQPNTVYHFRIYEFDGTGVNTSYLTSSFGSASQSTAVTPTTQASAISFNSILGNSLTMNWINGNGAARVIVARANSPVTGNPVNLSLYVGGAFGTGTQIGTGNFVVGNTSSSTLNVTGLTSGTTYYFSVFEYNGSNGPVYLTPGATANVTTPGVPQTQATNVTAGSVGTTSMQLNWTNGTGNRRLVLMKQGSAVDANPVDNTTYVANNFFGSGSQLGTGNYVVFDGVASTVTVTGLNSNTTYHFAVFEYNAFGGNSQFLTTNPARGNATTMTVLPVRFVDFKAANENNRIRLDWSTAQEQNSSHFEIERSSDGVSFRSIGTKAAAGNSTITRHYSFADESPLGGSNYYRLKQVDLDGHFIYSVVVMVMYTPSSFIRQFVNPVSASIDLSFLINEKGTWMLYDMNGKLLKQKSFNGSIIHEDASFLSAGMYFLQIKTENNSAILQLIKK